VVAPRLVLLNGLPGIGKSTLADRFPVALPRWVVLDADRIRRRMPEDLGQTVAAARGQVLARAAAHLGDGDDVVVPQLVARVDQLVRFEQVAFDLRADLVHVLLVDAGGDPVGRFHRRAGEDPWHTEVRGLVERQGGADVLAGYEKGLAKVVAERPDVRVVRSVEGDPDGTWGALVDAGAVTGSLGR